jgi:hypothetical protein
MCHTVPSLNGETYTAWQSYKGDGDALRPINNKLGLVIHNKPLTV